MVLSGSRILPKYSAGYGKTAKCLDGIRDLIMTTTREVVVAVFTLETDYPPETGYPLDNSCQTDILS